MTAVETLPTDFAQAQRRLFEAYALEPRPRDIHLASPAVRVHSFALSPNADGPPAFFLHGSAAFAAMFAPLFAELRGTPVIAIDRPGFGKSAPFTYTEESLPRVSEAVVRGVLDTLGLAQVDLVGHSLGGSVAIRFALAHPERVRSLVLIGAMPGFPGTQPPLPLRMMMTPVLGGLLQAAQPTGRRGVYAIADIFGEGDTVRDHPALVDAIAAHEADPDVSKAAASEYAALFSMWGWHDSVRLEPSELAQLRPPTTVIWGEKDPLGGPQEVREGLGAIPHLHLELLPAGHLPFLGHTARCAQIVREARRRARDPRPQPGQEP